MFKVGDKVECVDADASLLYRGKVYTIRTVNETGVFLDLEGVIGCWSAARFEKVEPSLDIELRLCESRRDIVAGRVGVLKQEEKSLEKRIQELQQAIKERDKPKGRVGLKDPLDTKERMYAVAGDGVIFTPTFARDKKEYRTLGNLFYDKESAERAVYDRKQRVLRGEDV